MRRLCIDIDNVVASTDEVLRNVISGYTAGRVSLAYDDVVEFDYWKCLDCRGQSISKNDWSAIHDAFSKDEILKTVRPVEGIQGHLDKLRPYFEIHLVTSRLPHAESATRAWLHVHGIPFDRLTFARHREKHLLQESYEAVIEDDYDQAVCFAAVGVNAYLIEHPWNRSKPVAPRVQWCKNWGEVTLRLTKVVS
jgi:uncharacterized HAD superfamily protein